MLMNIATIGLQDVLYDVDNGFKLGMLYDSYDTLCHQSFNACMMNILFQEGIFLSFPFLSR